MGAPTPLDVAILAPALVLGLFGIWLGFGRLLVAWPMRWLIPFCAACAVALPTVLYLATSGGMSALHDRSVAAGTAIAGAVSFLVTLVLLTMFMRNLRERVRVWTGGRRIGLAERVLGGVAGIACGLLLVAAPYGVYDSLRRVPDEEPAWGRESFAMPYLRSATEAVRSALATYFPPVPGSPPR